MPTTQFEKFIPKIRALTPEELIGGTSLFDKMRIAKTDRFEICYAPFDHLNPEARLVIVGITPGRTQMLNALREARGQLDAGATSLQALIAAKRTGAFSGPMRPNLVAMLDRVGLHQRFGLDSANEFFGAASNLLQSTSVLQNPVFLADGSNYNGTPNMTRNAPLTDQMMSGFAKSASLLPNAYFLPLGPKVSEALMFLANQGAIDGSRVLHGLPHPSPASMERINYFLGKKSREHLSKKTNASNLDAARERLMNQVASIVTSC
jgi:hypothetical protein